MKQNKQVNKEYRSYRETKDKIHCQIAQDTQIVIQLIILNYTLLITTKEIILLLLEVVKEIHILEHIEL